MHTKAALLAITIALTGCAPNNTATQQPNNRHPRILTSDDQRAATPSPRTARLSPPASIAGAPITWDDLHPALIEAAGATALQETILDRLLDQETLRLDITIEQTDLEKEQRTLLDSLNQNPRTAQQLLQQLRNQRGLGPTRYQALLHRTATMRAIVAPNVSLTEQSLALARAIRFGEKHQLRIITIQSLIEAQTAIQSLNRNQPFQEIAAKLSTDASAPRGGLIEPLSLDDPSYPAAIRAAARALTPGTHSAPITIEGGYAIIKLIEVIPASEPAAAEHILLEDARAEQERILMTQLARRLLATAPLTIIDPALKAAWNRSENQ